VVLRDSIVMERYLSEGKERTVVRPA